METNAAHNPPPIPIRDGLFSLNNTIIHPPISIIIIQQVNTVTPIGPVLTHINTYSESGGISDNFLNLLLAGISLDNIPKPIPHGASFMYFAMAVLLMSRTLADASSLLLNADLILRICWLLLPIFVNISINKRNPPIMANGTNILIDLARNK